MNANKPGVDSSNRAIRFFIARTLMGKTSGFSQGTRPEPTEPGKCDLPEWVPAHPRFAQVSVLATSAADARRSAARQFAHERGVRARYRIHPVGCRRVASKPRGVRQVPVSFNLAGKVQAGRSQCVTLYRVGVR